MASGGGEVTAVTGREEEGRRTRVLQPFVRSKFNGSCGLTIVL